MYCAARRRLRAENYDQLLNFLALGFKKIITLFPCQQILSLPLPSVSFVLLFCPFVAHVWKIYLKSEHESKQGEQCALCDEAAVLSAQTANTQGHCG